MKDSNTSLVIARKETLSEAQKEAIVNFVLDRMLGVKIASTEEELDKYLEEFGKYREISEELRGKMRRSIRQGLSVFSTIVFFDENFQTADLLNGLWEHIAQADQGSLVKLATSLEEE